MCWCEIIWHTVGAVALIAQNGTVEVALKGTFSLTGRLFCYSQSVHCLRKSWSGHCFPCMRKVTSVALSRTSGACDWFMVDFSGAENLKCQRAIKCTIFDSSSV